jgi:hypothetical protein
VRATNDDDPLFRDAGEGSDELADERLIGI